MHDISFPWADLTDPALREAEAAAMVDRAAALLDHPDWELVRNYIEANVETLTSSLIASESGGERKRGAIDALRHLNEMPNRLIEAAHSELKTHRGR